MPEKNRDLHGSAPDKSKIALLLIDVLNDLNFDEGPELLKHSLPMARKIAQLKKRVKAHNIPVIYCNDNFGRWQSDFKKILEATLDEDCLGKPLAELLRPENDDYFVLKPKHSAFFSTTLETLLRYLEVETLILTGIAGNICILFTANDAHMRDYRLIVPSDCIASNTVEENHYALRQLRDVMKVDVRPSTEHRFGDKVAA